MKVSRVTDNPGGCLGNLAKLAIEELEETGAIEATTAQSMRQHFRGPLRPLADRRARDVTAMDVQRWANLIDCRRSSLDRYMASLSTVWGWLVVRGQVDPLPFDSIRRPREEERAPVAALTLEQVHAIADAAGLHYGPIIRFQAYTGLRFGELAALTPADVLLNEDWTGGTLAVGRALKRDGRTGATKTHRRRSVALLELACDALRDYLDNERVAGRQLFVTHTGRRLHPGNWNQRVWLPALQLAGVPVPVGQANPLRHVFASILINRVGAPPAFVAQQMGHRDATITQQVYAHWYAADDTAIINRLNEELTR